MPERVFRRFPVAVEGRPSLLGRWFLCHGSLVWGEGQVPVWRGPEVIGEASGFDRRADGTVVCSVDIRGPLFGPLSPGDLSVWMINAETETEDMKTMIVRSGRIAGLVMGERAW
jgi:hypothetical protein